MTEKHTIDVLSNFTYIHFTLDPSYEDIQEIYEKRLYDLIDVNFDLSKNELRSMAEYGKKYSLILVKQQWLLNNT